MAENGVKAAADRIFLWTNPRSISTAFEKMMSFVDGCQLWHEPYVIPYFNTILTSPTNIEKFPRMAHMGKQFMEIRAEIDAANGTHFYEGGNLTPIKEFSYENMRDALDEPVADGKKFMFVKDMGLCIDGHYECLPTKAKWRHTFLIRDPRRLAVSAKTLLKKFFVYGEEEFDLMDKQPFVKWDQLNEDPLFLTYNYVRENFDPNPLIIDADDLLKYPKEVLTKYFSALGLEFKDSYLKWDSSIDFIKDAYGCQDLVAWGIQQKAYDRAFYSSEFITIKSPPKKWRDLPRDQLEYASEFEDGYRVMWQHRIRPF